MIFLNSSKMKAKYNAPPWTNQEAYQAYVVQNEDVKKHDSHSLE